MEEKVGGVLLEDSVLVECKEKIGVGGSWLGSHCCSLKLVQVRVPEEENIVEHHDGERFDEGICRDCGELTAMLVEVLCYLNDGHASVNVRTY